MGLFGGKSNEPSEQELQISRLESEKAELEKRLESMEAMNLKYQADARAFEAETETTRDRILAQIKKTEKAQDEIVRLNDLIRDLQNRLESTPKQDNSDSEVVDLRSKVLSLNSQLKEKLTMISKLEAKIAELHENESNLAAAKSTSDNNDEIIALRSTVAKLKEFLTNAKTMVLESREKEKEWQAERESYDKEISDLKARLTILLNELNNAKASSVSQEELVSLRQNVADLRKERDSATEEANKLRSDLSSMRVERDTATESLNKSQQDIDSLRKERDSLATELSNLKAKLSSLLG